MTERTTCSFRFSLTSHDEVCIGIYEWFGILIGRIIIMMGRLILRVVQLNKQRRGNIKLIYNKEAAGSTLASVYCAASLQTQHIISS